MMVNEIKKISYWNEYAKWYKLWLEHNSYHKPIREILLNFVSSGTKVLDIGAGNGVLSFPLIEKGCYVTAVEPAWMMQNYIYENAEKYGFQIKIDSRRFEDLNVSEIGQYDLALACNSLHLTEGGIESALSKIFCSGIKDVFIVTEKVFSFDEISLLFSDYKLFFNYSYLCESSFAYHSLDEVFEHWQVRYRRELFNWEKQRLLQLISYEKEHFWLKDSAFVNIFYWRRVK
ncbi:MAG: class I SAM-dependent methyltransferase [Thermodesulfovibrionaceae bacterium]